MIEADAAFMDWYYYLRSYTKLLAFAVYVKAVAASN
jgi:hypothetical protein